ncbi:MAG TPA: hypothetical protein VJ783_07830 [Pirellulales bacterium]|nr:hypothetical protein [Pirellulales bacterium]
MPRPKTVSPDPALGAVLLEQKIKAGTVGNAIFLLVLGILPMLVVGAPTAPAGVKVGFFLFGAGLAGFALWMLWRHWMHVFLQERGLREYRQRRGRSLPYDQADEITYSSLRIFMNGSYIHTVEKVALKSDREAGPPLVCTHIFKEADGRATGEARTPLLDVRNAVGLRLAERMSKQIAREAAIEWTPELRIRARGLEIVDARGRSELVEWGRLSRLEIDHGKLKLFHDGNDRPRLETPVATPNFYPAYFVAVRLWQEARGGSTRQ